MTLASSPLSVWIGAICSLISMAIATTSTFADCTLHHMFYDKAGRETHSFSSNCLGLRNTLTIMGAYRSGKYDASLMICICHELSSSIPTTFWFLVFHQ
jgi:hypothetical protein